MEGALATGGDEIGHAQALALKWDPTVRRSATESGMEAINLVGEIDW